MRRCGRERRPPGTPLQHTLAEGPPRSGLAAKIKAFQGFLGWNVPTVNLPLKHVKDKERLSDAVFRCVGGARPGRGWPTCEKGAEPGPRQAGPGPCEPQTVSVTSLSLFFPRTSE
jgi:hypothetical protein